MARRKKDRFYLREGRGWYADLRDYSDVGGKREAMKPVGGDRATEDRDEAVTLLVERLKELDALRVGQGAREDPSLLDYATYHLAIKAGYRRPSTVARDERSLRLVIGFFGREARLSEVTVKKLTQYIGHRRLQRGSRHGTTIASQTILNELHALSSLFKRALAEGLVDTNPVSRLPQRPTVEREERPYLETGEVARIFRVAADMDRTPHQHAVPYLLPILATFALTGGRAQEVLGLEVSDIDLENRVVHFRPNQHRLLKRPYHRRWVPLWPQLEAILADYPDRFDHRTGLLFPSRKGQMIRDLRGSLASVLRRAGIEKSVTLHTFRHTFAAARLQTTDHGAATSPYTVMRELGHRSLQLIEERYGHLANTRHRSEVLEYCEAVVLDFAQGRGA